MSNWRDSLKKSKTIMVTYGYVDCYNRVKLEVVINSKYAYTFAYRIKAGIPIGVEYQEDDDTMLVTNCSMQSAIGKYIRTPFNSNGTNIMIPTTEKVTTEANSNHSGGGTSFGDSGSSHGGGGTSFESGGSTDSEPIYIDNSFTDIVYSTTYTNTKNYYNNLQNGLRVKDLRGILGMPHQFLPITDPRIDTQTGIGYDDSFGRIYSEKIIKHIPLLLMTPGTPSFMSSFSNEQKTKIIGKLGNMTEETFNSIFADGRSGKYYSLKYAYTEYFHYVNAMLRSAAYFLEIQDETIDDGESLGTLNWLYKTSSMGSEIFSHGNLANFLGPYAGSIAFYADAGTTVDDSFSNSTQSSQLADALNGLSDSGRELNFLIGNIGGMAGVNLDLLGTSSTLDSTINDLTSSVDGILGNGNIIGNILGKATTIFAGGRIIFPEIWSDSSFSRSYSCSMKLVSPSGDKLSVFLNILVPIYHLLGFTLPRQADNQAYFSPFLVRAYYKGLFNVDMGIVTGLNITKGDEGEWTLDGIPTVANINFEIKDLYDGLYMSKQSLNNDYSIMSNIAELDYIANSCGVNVNDQEVMRTVRMYAALGWSNIKDKVTIGIFGNIAQYFNQKMQDIFGMF